LEKKLKAARTDTGVIADRITILEQSLNAQMALAASELADVQRDMQAEVWDTKERQRLEIESALVEITKDLVPRLSRDKILATSRGQDLQRFAQRVAEPRSWCGKCWKRQQHNEVNMTTDITMGGGSTTVSITLSSDEVSMLATGPEVDVRDFRGALSNGWDTDMRSKPCGGWRGPLRLTKSPRKPLLRRGRPSGLVAFAGVGVTPRSRDYAPCASCGCAALPPSVQMPNKKPRLEDGVKLTR
jgi:hypothetical protein